MVTVFNQIAPRRLPPLISDDLSDRRLEGSQHRCSDMKMGEDKALGTADKECYLSWAELDLVGGVVASIFQITKSELFNRRRGRAPVAFARQVAMYLLHIVCGRSFTYVGLKFGRDRTTVSHACQLIEDCREDPNVDWALDLMEHSVSSIAALFALDNN